MPFLAGTSAQCPVFPFQYPVSLVQCPVLKRMMLITAPSPHRAPIPSLLTVRENLELGSFASGDKKANAERLEEMFELFPILKSRCDQTAETMSGGEQQMCAIARGLMSRPKLLMLDELSLGLQPSLVEKVFETVVEIKKRGVTILLVEQMVQEALEIADRGYVLQTGRVVHEGSAQELLNSDEVRKAYMGM